MNGKRAIAVLPLMLACASPQLLAERVRLAEGTPVHLRLKADLAADQVMEGSRVDYVVARPVTVNGVAVIPEGAAAWGAVQSVKGKTLRIDIERVRLPNLTVIGLRTLPEKPSRSAEGEIIVEVQGSGNIVEPAGSEFTGFVDEDVWVDVPSAPATMEPASAVPPAPSAAPLQPARAIAAPATPPAPAIAGATVTAPATTPAPPPAPIASSAPASAAASTSAVASGTTGERVTVECFSDPLGADIVVDGDFYGSTPSILKLLVGNHRLEYFLTGYASYSQQLNLAPGSGLSTIRATLEKK